MIYQFCYYQPMKPGHFLKLAKHPIGKNFIFTSDVDQDASLKDIYKQKNPRAWVSLGRGILVTKNHKEYWWLHELLVTGKKGEKEKKKGFERFYKAALILAGKYKGEGLYCIQVNRKHPRYRNQLSHFCKFSITDKDLRMMKKPIQKAKFLIKLNEPVPGVPIRRVREKGVHDVILEMFGG